MINGNPEFYTIYHSIMKNPYTSPASLNGSISQAIFNKKMLVCFVMNYAYFSFFPPKILCYIQYEIIFLQSGQGKAPFAIVVTQLFEENVP